MNKIEYVGYNVSLDGNAEKKIYYHWEEVYRKYIPAQFADILNPFDYGIRSNGNEISVSAFIKGAASALFSIGSFIKSYFSLDHQTVDSIINSFIYVWNVDSRTHYNPIVSFKYRNRKLYKVSLYVSPLKVKGAMTDYVDRVFSVMDFNKSLSIRDDINETILKGLSHMFMVCWDFDCNGNSSYKLYLKIKKDEMKTYLSEKYPALREYMVVDGFRFREIAFTFQQNMFHHFNLYFKP